ncbi:hypothetical protein BJY16_006177 [Actinoplanes octamycinicus]|uniref:Uncharacterized protein n=1 Tax=Actinoplanes octamycinicus TaxID=135948 RepID=A0A7W7H2I2_9ACTN|nr:hypothetical protein [Actinoplanes octamycinicus]MBB4742718.1 hypothetical protein [Actinoplanes octamycinicus]GIE63019.1 hypothetical protein Aoc01nite_84210 [Actinoplanes octamycinicus]
MDGESRRGWLGFGVAIAPHVLLLGFMLVVSAGRGWAVAGYVTYWALLEIYLAPLGVIACFLLWFAKPTRAFAGGVAGGTVAGFVLVALWALLVYAAQG